MPSQTAASTSSQKNTSSSHLAMRSARSRRISKTIAIPSVYLRQSLPSGSLSYYDARRVGNGWGIWIRCPSCGRKPDVGVHPWQRWRWMSGHIAVAHLPLPETPAHKAKLLEKQMQKQSASKRVH